MAAQRLANGKKVSDEKLLALRQAGKSVTEIADQLKMAKSTISTRLKNLAIQTTPVCIKKENAKKYVGEGVDAIEVLERVIRRSELILTAYAEWQDGDIKASRRIFPPGTEPPSDGVIALRLMMDVMKEIRGHCGEISRILNSLFRFGIALKQQEIILEAIGNVDPELRFKIAAEIDRVAFVRGISGGPSEGYRATIDI